MQSKTKPAQDVDKQAPPDPLRYILQFLAVWVCSLVFIAFISLASDINWARAHLERSLSAEFGRDVKLGRLTWSLGLNGIQVESKTFSMTELAGEPFMTSARSEIGISVLGLIARKLVINHLDFESPALRLVKLGPDQWNFDDLLRPGPEIRLIQIEDGTVQLIDHTPGGAVSELPREVELTDFNLKLNWPRKQKQLPFYLAFDIPQDNHVTKFSVKGFSKGELNKENHATFTVEGKDVTAKDMQILASILETKLDDKSKSQEIKEEEQKKDLAAQQAKTHQQTSGAKIAENLDGMFSFRAKGEGDLQHGIKAKLEVTGKDVEINNNIFGKIDAGQPGGRADVELSKSKIAWQNFYLKLHGVEIRSSGSLSEWRSKESKIDAHVNSSIKDLKTLDGFIEKIETGGKNHFNRESFITSINPAKLSGSAVIDVDIVGTPSNASFETKVQTENLSVRDLLKDASAKLPMLLIAGVTDESKITGDIRLHGKNRIELADGHLSSPSAKIKATGFIDIGQEIAKLNFDARSISLKDTAISLGQNKEAMKQIAGTINLPGHNSFNMSGFADGRGDIMMTREHQSMDVALNLNDAGFSLNNNALSLSKVKGAVQVKTRDGIGSLELKNLSGYMGNGAFQLNGLVDLRKIPDFNIEFHATSYDLKHLSALLNLFQFQMPILTEKQLYGTVKDVRLKVTGTASNPHIYFSAIPDNLYYKPPGLTKPLRATAGEIVYDNDELVLTEVAIVSHGNVIQTSMTIEEVTGRCLLRRVKAKTVGIELADVHYYLSSPAMPPPLRKGYRELLSEYHISTPKGKAYGDILCLIHGEEDLELDGIIGCYKTEFKIAGYPITNLAGIFAASGKDLLLQDVSGVVRGSKFSLDGHVKDYRSKTPSWRTELSARLAPRELLELMPNLTEQLQTSAFKLTSKGPLTLRAKIQGSFESNYVQFALIADKKDELVIEAPFGKLHQPPGLPLTFDGAVTVDKHKIVIEDTHLLLGEALLIASGRVDWNDSDTEQVEKTADGKRRLFPPKSPDIVLNFKAAQETPVATLAALLSPTVAKDMTGTMKGSFTVKGSLEHPQLLGSVTFNKINAPIYKLRNLTGRIKGGKMDEAQNKNLIAKKGPRETPKTINPTVSDKSDAAKGKASDKNESEVKVSKAERKHQRDREAQDTRYLSDQKSWPKFTKEAATPAVLEIDTMELNDLKVSNVKAQLAMKPPDDEVPLPRVTVTHGTGEVASGNLKFEGWADFNSGAVQTKAVLENASADLLSSKMTGHPNEISGTTNATIELASKGDDPDELIGNLSGDVELEVRNGMVSRFGHLQTRLTQYNLITQGIFGFNLNNLLQSVWPVRTGRFDYLSNKFHIENGELDITALRYQGPDMRLWGSGKASLTDNDLHVDIAGKIPRVTQSMIGGSIGSVSRGMTLQRFMKMATLGKLENLPTLPVIGAIATDKPRSFTFEATGQLTEPSKIAKGIERSFKWLPNKPTATAHPVPGIDYKAAY